MAIPKHQLIFRRASVSHIIFSWKLDQTFFFYIRSSLCVFPTIYTVVHEISTSQYFHWFSIASHFPAWNVHWLGYFFYKIHFHCMKYSLIGSDSENSKHFKQQIISWITVLANLLKCFCFMFAYWFFLSAKNVSIFICFRKRFAPSMKSNGLPPYCSK